MLLYCGFCAKTLPELYLYHDSDLPVDFWFGHLCRMEVVSF